MLDNLFFSDRPVRALSFCFLIIAAFVSPAWSQTTCTTAVYQTGDVATYFVAGSHGKYTYATFGGEPRLRHLSCLGTDCAGQSVRPDGKIVSWTYTLAPMGDGNNEYQWLKEVIFQPAGPHWAEDAVRVNRHLVKCE